jgi:hypothetical protein
MFWEKKIMSIQLCPWSNGAPKYVYLHSNMNNRVLIMCKVKLKAIGSFISFFENAIPPPQTTKEKMCWVTCPSNYTLILFLSKSLRD